VAEKPLCDALKKSEEYFTRELGPALTASPELAAVPPYRDYIRALLLVRRLQKALTCLPE